MMESTCGDYEWLVDREEGIYHGLDDFDSARLGGRLFDKAECKARLDVVLEFH